LSKRELSARRSTRLAIQIPVILTSLDPAYCFHKECKTAIVKLVSNGATKKGRVVLAIPFLRIFHGFWEWSSTAQGTFGKWNIRQQTGAPESRKRVSRRPMPVSC
jgi:hypothetical protein